MISTLRDRHGCSGFLPLLYCELLIPISIYLNIHAAHTQICTYPRDISE